VVADEIYEHINSQELLQHCIYPRNARKTVLSVAKAFAMTDGELVILGPESSPKLVPKIQGQVTSGANSIAQRATITAVDADPKRFTTHGRSIAVEI
jgi:aspartate aminotransferase